MPRARPARGPGADAARILVVDDAPDTLELVRRNLVMRGYRVRTASGTREALAMLDDAPVDLVITDIRMPGRSGLELIREARVRRPDIEIIVITGYATIEGAVEALHIGAWDYLSKPFTDEELLQAVRRVLGRRARPADPSHPARRVEFHGLLGEALVTRTLVAELEAAAGEHVPLLLVGESGSGRETAARALHEQSGRTGRFLRVSLDARGADPGLANDLDHALRDCRGGTLYLASIDMARGAAVRALAAVVPASRGKRRGPAGARIVASAAIAPEALGKRGRAWSALVGRFASRITIPPLRDRGDDAVRLAERFLAEGAADAGVPERVLAEPTAQALRAYGWPGNVGELRALGAGLAWSARTGPVQPGELPAHVAGALPGLEGQDPSLAAAERRHVAEVLRRAGGNKSRAAEILGIDRKTLREKLRGPGTRTGRDDGDE
jgi:two-component system, NtrC family, response regulator HydG